MLENFAIEAGAPSPLAATFDGNGVNFAVFSRHATQVTLCLYNEAGHETQLIAMPERDGHAWHGYIPGMGPGQQYGYRTAPSFSSGTGSAPRVPMHETLLYEAHVKGLTATHSGVGAPGTYRGMASGTPPYIPREAALLVDLNAGDATRITPPPVENAQWLRAFDTSTSARAPLVTDTCTHPQPGIDANCVVVFELQPTPEGQTHGP